MRADESEKYEANAVAGRAGLLHNAKSTQRNIPTEWPSVGMFHYIRKIKAEMQNGQATVKKLLPAFSLV